jgi:hypothetical protein
MASPMSIIEILVFCLLLLDSWLFVTAVSGRGKSGFPLLYPYLLDHHYFLKLIFFTVGDSGMADDAMTSHLFSRVWSIHRRMEFVQSKHIEETPQYCNSDCSMIPTIFEMYVFSN